MNKFFEGLFRKEIIGPVIIVAVGFLLYKIIKVIVEKIFIHGKNTYEQKKRKTIVNLTNNVIKFFLYAIMLIMILDIYGIDTRSFIASLGIAGVVIGLALQETAQDFISGIAIITENYYVVGDLVTVNNFTGEVIELSLKSTKIKSISGEVLVIANHNITSVINLSQERAGIKVEVPTAYEENSDKVEKVLKQVVEQAKKIPNVYPDSKYLGMEEFKDSAITYSFVVYCKQSERFDIKRRILKLVKEFYEQENLKIPYNQIEVHNGKDIV